MIIKVTGEYIYNSNSIKLLRGELHQKQDCKIKHLAGILNEDDKLESYGYKFSNPFMDSI